MKTNKIKTLIIVNWISIAYIIFVFSLTAKKIIASLTILLVILASTIIRILSLKKYAIDKNTYGFIGISYVVGFFYSSFGLFYIISTQSSLFSKPLIHGYLLLISFGFLILGLFLGYFAYKTHDEFKHNFKK